MFVMEEDAESRVPEDFSGSVEVKGFLLEGMGKEVREGFAW